MNIKYIYVAIILILLSVIGYQYFQTKVPQSINTPRNFDSPDGDTGLNDGLGRGRGGTGSMDSAGMKNSKNNCVADGCLAIDGLNYPAGELTETVKTALSEALDDEYKAHATYEAVIKELGNIRPFIMIIRAEEQHISSLKALYDKYGLAIPENPYTGTITSPKTISEACATGVEAEIANANLYKSQLLPNVDGYEDITGVFTNLMNASLQKHLTAFEKCSN